MATKAQKDRIKAILESDEYDTADKMAAAILKEASAIIGEADSWVGMTWGIPFELWGPFGDKTTGKVFAKRLMDLYSAQENKGKSVKFYKVNGTNALTDREQLVSPEVNKGTCECGHPEYVHLNGAKSGNGCLHSGCKCKKTYSVYKR